VSNTNPTFLTDTQAGAERIGVATPAVATDLGRRRELLGWRHAECARRRTESRAVINEIGRVAGGRGAAPMGSSAAGADVPTRTALAHPYEREVALRDR
jgi:hypothetical protein